MAVGEGVAVAVAVGFALGVGFADVGFGEGVGLWVAVAVGELAAAGIAETVVPVGVWPDDEVGESVVVTPPPDACD